MNNFEKAGYPDWFATMIVVCGYIFFALAAGFCLFIIGCTIFWWIDKIITHMRQRKNRRYYREMVNFKRLRNKALQDAVEAQMLTANQVRDIVNRKAFEEFGRTEDDDKSNHPQD